MRNNEQGITIIALIVAVIILVLLASISIGVLNNGLIDHAGSAKENMELTGEMDIMKQAIITATVRNKYNNFTIEEFKKSIKDYADVEKVKKRTIITFKDSKRQYTIDDDGNIQEYIYKEPQFMEYGSTFNERMKDYKSKILTVEVVDYIVIPENSIEFDVSIEKNGKVKAWLVPNEANQEMYDLYIGGDRRSRHKKLWQHV